ncbi:MAG: helicase/secretion neighborhood putative DEAH-box helicase [Actinomycetia bacterium]|nr:helicase/secretion neighborhood putative DEAH-box helicase [Actinomycetes bacterium]
MDACDTLSLLALDPELPDRVAFRETIPARLARTGTATDPLHPKVLERLAGRGIESLYTHQAEAIDALRAGRHTAIATGTASGKSLCYQVPIVESALARSGDTALMLYPTKALAQDQLRALHEWLVPDLVAVTYDGDTPVDQRIWARKHANTLLTNPEMLHQGILPFHQRWATFLMRLRWVVIDELHTLRGVFGSHVALLLRRLRRLCAHYGSYPTFCFASATIGNPADLASALCGLPVDGVTDDGSPRGERSFAAWQRPFIGPGGYARTSAYSETAFLLGRFVRDGHQTLAFTRSRRGSELVAASARRNLEVEAPEMAGRVASYRAGYLASERRELEESLVTGELAGLAATNALELGIDVGGLDAIVMNGFPGTLASMWQQIGRAGRTGQRAAAVLVAGDDQLDQWYLRHPGELLGRAPEAAVINPDNPFVLTPHVACATHELPLTHADDVYFGAGLDDAVRDLVFRDLVRLRGGRMFWAGQEPPAPKVGLRSGSTVEFQLVARNDHGGHLVGTVDDARVFAVAHPGAIYVHLGRQYRVDTLDLVDRIAWMEPADDADEYTQTREETDITVIDDERSMPCGDGVAHLGTVEVTTRILAYQRRRASTREVLETVPLDLPERTLTTRACWYTLPAAALVAAGVQPSQVLGAVHAAEHALIGLLPLFTICDRWDVGGVSMAMHPQTLQPTIFVYDGYAGGAGIADLAYADVREHVQATLELVRDCACDDGCPSCVQSPKCGNLNEYLDKGAGLAILRSLSG